LTNAAERLATGVADSRRGFLARFGKAALATAAAVVGLLALPKEAQAVPKGKCCKGGRPDPSLCGPGYLCLQCQCVPHGPTLR
jgi:hypothetical protein